MTALTVEVISVHPPIPDYYPWPTVVGTVVHGQDAGDVIRVAADRHAADAIRADLAELGGMPPVIVVEPWQVVALVMAAEDVERAEAAGRAAAYPYAAAAYRDGDYRTCDGCGAVEDAGTGPDLDGYGFATCCTAVTS